jgi:CheY-like chemotaxis protein
MAKFNHIFLIDDDELFLMVTKIIMEDEDFAEEIHIFEHAKEALDHLKNSSEEDYPELIFLDINMPMMDGWEFMDALEEESLVNKLKIYITSSTINPIDLDKAEKNPFVTAFMSKPIDPAKLKTIVERSKKK